MTMVLQIGLGLLVGLLAGLMHLALSWRAARHTVESRKGTFVVALMPVRVLAVALPIAALASIGTASVLAGLVGFTVSHRTVRARWPREQTS